jgi:hypothetical protein
MTPNELYDYVMQEDDRILKMLNDCVIAKPVKMGVKK